MKLMTIALGACLAAGAGYTCAAAPEPAMTADDLQQLCGGTDHVSRNACRIYILGVTQGIAVGLKMAGGTVTAAHPCVPSDISAESLEERVKKKLDADLAHSPADKSLDASAFVAKVLLGAYPCKAGG